MTRHLPTSIEVDGEYYSINSDYRRILDIIDMYNDENMPVLDKHLCMLGMLYTYFDEDGNEIECIPNNIEEAILKGTLFIDRGEERNQSEEVKPRIIDYNKDSELIFSAINKNKVEDIRVSDYIHWFTFVGYLYNFTEDDLISHIMKIRSKKSKGETLDKYEKKFYNDNRSIIDIDFLPTDKKDREEFYDLLNKRFEEFYGEDYDGSNHEDTFVKLNDKSKLDMEAITEGFENYKNGRK